MNVTIKMVTRSGKVFYSRQETIGKNPLNAMAIIRKRYGAREITNNDDMIILAGLYNPACAAIGHNTNGEDWRFMYVINREV